MLTPRERAACAYGAARAQGRGRILGADGMVEITETRLANARRAVRIIATARGTERSLCTEPDYARLEQMQQWVDALVETLEADRSRWAAARNDR